MTYYEELGVPAAASVEEIRRAYHRLVKLLHTDQCGDGETRRLAELQMKRLNNVLAILADEGRRAEYDAALAAPPPALATRSGISRCVRRLSGR
jgi:curved DNA-binding protein CbpA